MPKLTVALVQHSKDPRLTAAAPSLEQAIAAAQQQGADLVVLAELYQHQYFCQTIDEEHFKLAEKIPGPSTTLLSNLAKQHKIVLVGSIFERRTAGIYHNTAVVFDRDGSLAGRYRKMHIPDDPGYYEKYYFTPGDQGFIPINTTIGRLGVLICWDQWYPEAARLMALAGAELLIYPTAIGHDDNETPEQQDTHLDAWITSQRAHAIANTIPVITCNRVGFEATPTNSEQGIQFWGNSFVCDGYGRILAQASAQQPELLITKIDSQQAENIRQQWPYFRDRRIDAYQPLIKRFND